MTRDRVVHPRRMWSGIVVALAGACLLALWTAAWQAAAGIAGAVLFVAGSLTAAFAGVLYDTHGGGRPITGEIDDLREARGHPGTRPGDMITDPRIRAHAAMTSRRSEAVRAASRPTSRPALQPLGAWLLLAGAIALIVAQGSYPHTQTGQHNATRSLLLGVVVALAALRIQLAQRAGRFPSALAAAAGGLLMVFALVTHHDRHAIVYFEIVAGAWIFMAALLTFDRPREHPVPATLPGPSSGTAMTSLVRERAGVTPGLSLPWSTVLARQPREDPGSRTTRTDQAPDRAGSGLRTVVVLMLLVVAAARALRRRRAHHHAHGPSDQRGSLRYHVPVGQDPAAVIAALRQAGYDVRREHAPTRIQEIVISQATGAGVDRSAVRAVIAQAPIDVEGAPAPAHEVVFADEPAPRSA